eukprot:503897-Rhodomonas_salina.1
MITLAPASLGRGSKSQPTLELWHAPAPSHSEEWIRYTLQERTCASACASCDCRVPFSPPCLSLGRCRAPLLPRLLPSAYSSEASGN